MKKIYLLTIVFGLFLFSACSQPTIYTKPEFSKDTKAHQIVAILPFNVSIDTKNQSKKFTLEVAKKAEKDEASMFQQQLYVQFLKRQGKGEYTVNFQDIDQTNAVLLKNGITYSNIYTFTKSDLAKMLGADALISGTIRRTKPMSTGGAMVLGLLAGAWGSTNRVDVTINIHDGKNSSLLWKYDHEASGSVGSSAEGLAKSLMKGISKDFPYSKEK